MIIAVFKTISILFIAFVAIFLFIRYIERNSIFFPSKEIETTPEFLELKYEGVYFGSLDGTKLHSWIVPFSNEGFNPKDPSILFCHGNAGNISHRLAKIKIFHDLGFNIFIFDYRGYGKSQGSPSEEGIYKDTQAAYNYLKNELGAEKIIGFGESLGSAVIIDLASKQDLDALIVESGFSSARAMGKRIYPIVPAFVFNAKFDSINKVKNIKCPKLIIHSVNDEIVPFKQAQDLYEAAAEPKIFVELVGGHNDCALVSQEKFEQAITDFARRQAPVKQEGVE